ncbi:MAG: hypothetical protein A2Y18_03515 [Clostridiales bacterium GWD2_32_19]|nr:MAG: hypothetical protein A2Y18_03515 [Clostridiales bacterium GWD2_32_19]
MITRNFSLAIKAVVVKDNQYLLLHKSVSEMEKTKINSHNPWDLPGGSIQFFEKNVDGLLREVKEETGLNVKVIKPLYVYDAIRPHLHMTIITYLCKYTSGILSLSNEHDSYKWITHEELDSLDMPEWLKNYFYMAIEEYENL